MTTARAVVRRLCSLLRWGRRSVEGPGLLRLVALALLTFAVVGCHKKEENKLTGTTLGFNPDGVWEYVLNPAVYIPGTCGFTQNPYNNNAHSLIIIDENNGTIGANDRRNGQYYSGTWSNNRARMTATYMVGIMRQTDTITFTQSNEGNAFGEVAWTLKNGDEQCAGTYRLSMVRP